MIDDLTRSVLEQRDNIENQRNRELNSNRETYIKQLQQENQQQKEVIEEIREYIKRFDFERLHECCEHNLVEVLEVILQILDKYKN